MTIAGVGTAVLLVWLAQAIDILIEAWQKGWL